MIEAKDLAGVSLFAGLSDDELANVAGLFQEAFVPQGRRLAMQGNFGYRFFVILEGTADVRIGHDVVAGFGPGDFFGEIALVEEERRTADVEATSMMRVGSMMIWDFRELVTAMPDIEAQIQAAVAERLGR